MDQLYERILEAYMDINCASRNADCDQIQDELREKKMPQVATRKKITDRLERLMEQVPLAMQLHLELDMEGLDEERKDVLRKYGRMQESISRDFIVPGNITLRALHYAIMRAFGWQNSHLHSFEPEADEFKKMTDGGLVTEWARQVGMYFRFPRDDYVDGYWENDYDGDMSLKLWLKTMYTGPYLYNNPIEQYVYAQHEMKDLFKRFPILKKKTTDQRDWPLLVEGRCEELLERNTLWRVLLAPNQRRDWSEWKAQKEEILETVGNYYAEIRKKLIRQNNKTQRLVEQLDECREKLGKLPEKMDEIQQGLFKVKLQECDLARAYNPEATPVLSALLYRYDFGDGWKIKISCTNAWYDRSTYAKDEEEALILKEKNLVPEISLFQDAFDQEVTGEELERVLAVTRKQKPICIAWDGLKLVEDVGGIVGFCDFLKTINGPDPAEKDFHLEWAKDLGWTGRMPKKPENLL